jgi:hypothetical protein
MKLENLAPAQNFDGARNSALFLFEFFVTAPKFSRVFENRGHFIIPELAKLWVNSQPPRQVCRPRMGFHHAETCVSSKAALDYVARHRLKRLKELIWVVPVLMGIVFNTRPSLKPAVSLGTQLFNLRLK